MSTELLEAAGIPRQQAQDLYDAVWARMKTPPAESIFQRVIYPPKDKKLTTTMRRIVHRINLYAPYGKSS